LFGQEGKKWAWLPHTLFHKHIVIPWSSVPNFLDGKCNRYGKEIQFVLKKCTSILVILFEAPNINSCLPMSTYHCVFGLENKQVENLAMDWPRS
jgi:hypothetical protein